MFLTIFHDAGDSEGNDDGSARVPAQWLERHGWYSSSYIIRRCLYISHDTARTAQ